MSLEYKWKNYCCTYHTGLYHMYHIIRGLTGPSVNPSVHSLSCMLSLSCVCMTLYTHGLLYTWIYIAFRESSLVFALPFFSPSFFFLLILFFSLNKTCTCSPFPLENLQKASSFKVFIWYSWKTWHICISQSGNINFLQLPDVSFMVSQAVTLWREQKEWE